MPMELVQGAIRGRDKPELRTFGNAFAWCVERWWWGEHLVSAWSHPSLRTTFFSSHTTTMVLCNILLAFAAAFGAAYASAITAAAELKPRQNSYTDPALIGWVTIPDLRGCE